MVNNRPMRKRQSYYDKCKHKTHAELTRDRAVNQTVHRIMEAMTTIITIPGSVIVGMTVAMTQNPNVHSIDEPLRILTILLFCIFIVALLQAYGTW